MSIDINYIESRVNRSKESLEEAKLLFDNEHYLTVVNRLYYAVFYLACGFLGRINVASKTHTGTKSKSHEHFLKEQIINYDFGKLYDRLFRERNDTDYGDFQILSKQEVQELIFETEEQLKKYWKEFEN